VSIVVFNDQAHVNMGVHILYRRFVAILRHCSGHFRISASICINSWITSRLNSQSDIQVLGVAVLYTGGTGVLCLRGGLVAVGGITVGGKLVNVGGSCVGGTSVGGIAVFVGCGVAVGSHVNALAVDDASNMIMNSTIMVFFISHPSQNNRFPFGS
jgi:hypothetical protein